MKTRILILAMVMFGAITCGQKPDLAGKQFQSHTSVYESWDKEGKFHSLEWKGSITVKSDSLRVEISSVKFTEPISRRVDKDSTVYVFTTDKKGVQTFYTFDEGVSWIKGESTIILGKASYTILK